MEFELLLSLYHHPPFPSRLSPPPVSPQPPAAASGAHIHSISSLAVAPTSLHLFHDITHAVSYTTRTFHAGEHVDRSIDRLLAVKPSRDVAVAAASRTLPTTPLTNGFTSELGARWVPTHLDGSARLSPPSRAHPLQNPLLPRHRLILSSSSRVSVYAHDRIVDATLVGSCTLPGAACDVKAASATLCRLANTEPVNRFTKFSSQSLCDS
ncbi:hypothetical protein CVT26_004363 [Gymnopilus dilepis]|uniref:Uncharacterized protein n=1 Tax=Gymnopilus dilepis TaxID=231916 RepID=A0A409W6Q6_9AGAR|nr:hypothetical protein CVT26_004363 [Gymnopilus dilepis]